MFYGTHFLSGNVQGLLSFTVPDAARLLYAHRMNHSPAITRTITTPACVLRDTPHRPMITHTSDSHQIPSQNKTKSKLQILKNCQKFKFYFFCKKLYMQHTFWCCLVRCINMIKYQMDPTRTVGATEWTWDAGRTEGRTDSRTDRRSETNIPPQ